MLNKIVTGASSGVMDVANLAPNCGLDENWIHWLDGYLNGAHVHADHSLADAVVTSSVLATGAGGSELVHTLQPRTVIITGTTLPIKVKAFTSEIVGHERIEFASTSHYGQRFLDGVTPVVSTALYCTDAEVSYDATVYGLAVDVIISVSSTDARGFTLNWRAGTALDARSASNSTTGWYFRINYMAVGVVSGVIPNAH
jgi:hypothetical protein